MSTAETRNSIDIARLKTEIKHIGQAIDQIRSATITSGEKLSQYAVQMERFAALLDGAIDELAASRTDVSELKRQLQEAKDEAREAIAAAKEEAKDGLKASNDAAKVEIEKLKKDDVEIRKQRLWLLGTLGVALIGLAMALVEKLQ